MTELVPKSEQTLVRAEPTTYDLIRELAADERVSVEKLAALMDLQERAEARNAEREFNADFAAASAEMPRVRKDGVIDMGGKGQMKFARYEDIDSAIRPVELRYGFTRTFLTEQTPTGVQMTCKLSHRGGHSERSSRFMPPDTGAGRNAMQAVGSASSYAKRYLTLDIWNIVTMGVDDDARAAHAITDEQAMRINTMVSDCDFTAAQRSKFLAWAGAASVEAIQEQDYQRVITWLNGRLKAKREG